MSFTLSYQPQKTNSSNVVKDCRRCDIHFNLDNEEYLFTIIEKRRKRNNKKRKCFTFTNTFAFCVHLFSCRVCLSVRAKREHLYQDKHTSQCHFYICKQFLLFTLLNLLSSLTFERFYVSFL